MSRARRAAVPVLPLGLLLVVGCIAPPLSDAQLEQHIEQQSKPYPTAVLLADCLADACRDNTVGCQLACLDGASKAVRPIGEKLWSCWKSECHEKTCKNVTDPPCLSSCLLERCGDIVLEVLQAEPAGADDCSATLNCVQACDPAKPRPFACMRTCLHKATSRAAQALTTYAACSASGEGKVEKRCHAELIACHSDTLSDSGECYTFAGCLQACLLNDGGDGCWLTCRDRLGAEAKPTFDALLPCMDKPASGTPKCREAVLGCIDPSGSQTCRQAQRCGAACSLEVGGGEGFACMYACMHNATPAAAQSFMALGACEGLNKKGCASALESCAAPSGTKGCADIQPCMTSCIENKGAKGIHSEELTCTLDCLHQATPEAAGAFLGVISCVQPCLADCGGGASCEGKCWSETCKASVQACAK